MTLDATLELSVEQLVSVLNKKIFMECTRVQLMAPPASRGLVATLATEVRFGELKKNQVLTRWFTGRRSGGTSQSRSTRSDFPEELPTTCQPS